MQDDDPNRHILVVEDEFVAALALEQFLKSKGCNVSVAANGLEALEILYTTARGSDGVDVVLTDLRMPRMTGNELIERLRTDRPQLPIIVMTAYASEQKFPSDRALIKMRKPINLNEVWETIRKITE